MQVIYKNELDKKGFDKERYRESLKRYGEIDEERFEQAVKNLEPYAIRHVSCLVKEAIPVFVNENDAKNYWEEHQINGVGFERLARITGLCYN